MDSRGYDEHRRNRGYGGREHGRGPGARPGPRGDYVLRADGTPLTDRYGRPVRRRAGTGSGAPQDPPRGRRVPSRREVPPTRQAPASRQVPPRGASPVGATRQYVPPVPTAAENRGARGEDWRPQRRPPIPRAAQPAPARPDLGGRGSHGGGRGAGRLPRMGCLGCVGWPLAVLLVLAIVVTLWSDAKLTRVEALPEQQVAKTSGTNWLLVGSDSRQGLTEEDVERLGTGGDIGVGRTDTVMLLHIPRGGKATLVSLPRDSYVSVPGYGMDKLNAAFTYGGPQLLTETVEQATGLRINHYAEIGMGGLANVVDSVGGVEVCPEEPIDDPLAQLSIQAGCQKVDGPTALGYVRTRATAGGDLDRVQRQREFFSGLLNQTTSAGTLLNPFRMIPLISDTASSFTVGSSDHVWNLARVALAMRSGVETVTVPYAGFADYDVGNVVLWDEAAAEELWASMR
ncbi:LCP family protein [Corynebacterium mastitidis]|nr:LCP family protein [Corynebacterium mastitidis]MCH6197343.1 LCP family protein [Corynebacterium mastitidis]